MFSPAFSSRAFSLHADDSSLSLSTQPVSSLLSYALCLFTRGFSTGHKKRRKRNVSEIRLKLSSAVWYLQKKKTKEMWRRDGEDDIPALPGAFYPNVRAIRPPLSPARLYRVPLSRKARVFEDVPHKRIWLRTSTQRDDQSLRLRYDGHVIFSHPMYPDLFSVPAYSARELFVAGTDTQNDVPEIP